MSRKGSFNGHPSWNAWNIALWIANDEGLYRLAVDCIRQNNRRWIPAAKEFMEALESPQTPDGAPWTITNIVRAMRGLES